MSTDVWQWWLSQDDAPVAANVTSGVMKPLHLSIYAHAGSGVVSGLALQSYGQLSRIVWEVPVVNCNRVSYYTVAMTTYADGTLIETGTTTDQNYTLTKNYTAGVPYKATVWASFGTVAGGNTSQTIFTQELVPTSLQNMTVTPINGSTIVVSWNPLSPVEARGFVRYYLVTWTPSSSKARGTAGSANLTADATMFLITGLDPMVSYTISVSAGTSAGPPNRPTNVMGKYVSNTIATIQWMVPFIAYTRETYVVRYGSAPDNLNQSSILVNGSADLNVTGAQFGVNLTGLVPYSLYYFTIEASNTEGTTTTPVMTLSFFPGTSNGALAALVVLPLAIVAIAIVIKLLLIRKSNKSERSNKSEQVTLTRISPQQDQKGSSNDSGTNSNAVEEPESGKTTEDQLATQPIPEKIGKMTEVQQPIVLKDLENTINSVGPSWKSVWESLPGSSTPAKGTNIEEMNLSEVHMKPGDSSRGAMLPYGNAIFVNGYDGSPNAYIAAQAPLQNTVEDFWMMVLGVECTTIVVLYSLSEVVKVTLYHYIGSANEEPGNGWPEHERPKDEEQFCAFCNEVQTKGHETPIVVMCNDGVGHTGTFITILAMLEMAKKERNVDMVQIITSIRARCPAFIPDEEHLRLCYDTVLYWHKFE
eukprot:Em0011g1151a